MQRGNSTIRVSSSRLLDALLQSNNDSTINGEEVSLLFQLLRQADPSMSLAWHSIWHGLGLTP